VGLFGTTGAAERNLYLPSVALRISVRSVSDCGFFTSRRMTMSVGVTGLP
jgi:hypothetical protein